ncbi:MAG TPA: efflux RND transporter periplasmic adaptor subunit [Gammaproteobacteria bacterium]|nr:efflux RND transporter periplasmic adaptor subunit [Gammaproteobacteria bacterium]
MAKRIFITIGISLLVMLVIYGTFGIKVALAIKKFSNMKQVTVVSDEAAKGESWQPQLIAIGNLVPVRGVEVSNQLAGTVTAINIESGQEVKKGDLLLQLDDSSQRAQLQGFQAQAKLAQLTLERTQKLYKKNLASQADLDTASSNLKAAQANVDNTQSAMDKLAIRAPFSGYLGIRNVNIGQYLAAGSDIVSLQSLDTLYASFALPEQNIAVLRVGQKVQVTVDTYPDMTFDGKLDAIESRVDPDTHNVMVQAVIQNPKHLLRAGMFANITVLAGKPAPVVTVPKSAVDYSLYGSSLYLVHPGKDKDGKPDFTVNQVFVTTGEERGGRVAIEKGIKAGDLIVTAGQQKLHDGMEVEINNSVQLD